MKKILSGALAFMLFAGAAQAQTRDTVRHQHRGGGYEMKANTMNLTADQQARLKNIHQERKKEMEALKTSSLTGEQLKAKREELHKKYRSQMEAVYTPEQKQQLEKRKAEWKAKGKEAKKDAKQKGRKDAKKGGRGGDFAKQLNLTQDQQDRMAKLRTDSKSQFEAVRNDKSLTEDQKKAKFQELRRAQQEQMKSILTKEQLDQMQSHRKDRKPETKK